MADPAATIRTDDYHTAGEPFRIVVGGVPALEGATVLERREHALRELDHVRRLLVNEPLGHADMYGCFVTPPDDRDADFGAVFFHNAGYSTACGHGTIALATWAIDTGRIPAEPHTSVRIDVPSGRLTAEATVEDGDVRSVRFRNVPAYVHSLELTVATSSGPLTCDVAFGGAFYASVDARSIDARPTPEHLDRLIVLGREIKRELEAGGEFVDPVEPRLRDIYGVTFYEPLADVAGVGQRNVTVFADGEVDRSPCGSGTSARLATLHARGELAVDQPFVHRSLVDTEFRAWIVEETAVADRAAVTTDVEGAAFATGTHEFTLDPRDPLGTGFLLR